MTTHLFSFSNLKPQHQYDGGYRVSCTKKDFPELNGMSFYKLVLKASGVREPHWHANADELGYCLQGKVLINIYANHNDRQSFIVSAGECFFVPSGSLHGLVNIGDQDAVLAIQFSNAEPEDFGLSGTFGMFTDAVLGNTWDKTSDFFSGWKRSTQTTFISQLDKPFDVSQISNYPSPYHLPLEGRPATIDNAAGTVHVARKDTWPILHQQALYSLRLTNKGMREPHWHPETAEMGYVIEGKGRMSILSPSGSVDTYEMNVGDLYFIPKAYPHHIENLGPSDLRLLIFFDNSMPEDIGFSGSVKSFPNEVLSSSLKFPSEKISEVPTYDEDLLIVNRINPVDLFILNSAVEDDKSTQSFEPEPPLMRGAFTFWE